MDSLATAAAVFEIDTEPVSSSDAAAADATTTSDTDTILASMTKVSRYRQTRTTASPIRQEETNLRPIPPASPHDFERAARSGSDGCEDRADGFLGQEEPPARVPLAELQLRAGIKFSGIAGAVVASGSVPATTAATFELARYFRKVILGLPAVLFDRSAKPRPCGLLCKLSGRAC